jgi:hypothetical protein
LINLTNYAAGQLLFALAEGLALTTNCGDVDWGHKMQKRAGFVRRMAEQNATKITDFFKDY